jgi:uncharacterized protein (DUF58 family)
VSLPPEILKKVKLLEIGTRKLVNSIFAGQYKSAFRGQGMTFAEFREYVPGDDVRAISWTLTARAGKPFIKKFDEERELILMLVVDASGSTAFGTRQFFKGEVMIHLAAVLGFAAAKNNDHVGLLMFTDQVEHFVPPKKGRGHVQRILRDLYFRQPRGRGTRISVALDYLQGILKKRSVIFVFSDFMDKSFAESMRRMARKHDVIACVVRDPAERRLPDAGLIDLEDPETGAVLTVDAGSPSFRSAYDSLVARQDAEREAELRRARVERVVTSTDGEFLEPLLAYFRAKSVGKSGRA